MVTVCIGFQDGETFALYKDGDVTAAQGHLSLLKLRRELSQRSNGRRASPDLFQETTAVADKDEVPYDLTYTHRAAEWGEHKGNCML